MFEKVKNEILAVGFDEILNIPRATDAKTELAIALLNDAGMSCTVSSLTHFLILGLQGSTPIGIHPSMHSWI